MGAAAGCLLPVATPAREAITITDRRGRPIKLPTPSDRIADGWPAHSAVLITLGAAARIVATANSPSSRPWMYKVAPELYKAQFVQGGNFNVDELIERRTQLVFLTPGMGVGDVLARSGMTVVDMTFYDIATLRTCVAQTAALLGGEAPDRASAYLRHLDAELNAVTSVTRSIPMDARPRILHFPQISPAMTADGGNTLIDAWINAAGGRNAASDIEGNARPVSIEQVAAWDPDIIIIAAAAARQQRPVGFDTLRAARRQALLVNPEGMFLWDRYGTELPLQLVWAAQQFHPSRFKHIDLIAKTIAFYRKFLGYELKEPDAQRIIAGLPPTGL